MSRHIKQNRYLGTYLLYTLQELTKKNRIDITLILWTKINLPFNGLYKNRTFECDFLLNNIMIAMMVNESHK